MADEICRKCSAQENTLLYCHGGVGQVIGCVERRQTDHLHVSCAHCKAPIRVRECDDAA